MRGIHRLRGGHHHFRAWAKTEREALRRLAKGQSPDAVVVSCSDSRVIPELILNVEPGSVFVVRNVANLVPKVGSGDASVGAALEYAIDTLRVHHLIVLGHYGCGGMAAIRDAFAHAHEPGHRPVPGQLGAWLEHGHDSWDELVHAGDAECADWHERLVEENVLQQLANAYAWPVVQRAVAEGRLQLHAWTYDLATASLRVWDPDQEKFTATGAGSITPEQLDEQDHV